MQSESSIATRLLACLVVAMLVGGAGAGTAAGASSAGSVLPSATALSTTDAVDGSLDETTEALENTTETTTDTVEDTTDTTTDSVENTSGTTTDSVEDATDSTTDALENETDDSDGSGETGDGVDETTETVDDTVDTTTDTVDGTVDTTTDTVDTTTDTVDETGETVDETTIDAALEAGLGTRESNPSGSSDGTATAENASAGSGGDADGASDGTETATDAILVGMLGAITASGAAASGAGATGTAGGGSAATAGWLHTLRETRLLRRAGTDLWKLLPLFRYSQYDDSDPLEHDRRRALYETIEAEPGSYLSQLSDETGVPLSTVRHHVRILEEEGLITTSKHTGKRRYFLEGADAELQAALAEPAKRDVLEALAALGRAHNGRLADELERDPSTVSHHLAGLEDDGLVMRERDGRSIVNELPPRVERALGGDSPPTGDAEPAPADD
ncbi:winged helix-turn-helix transcriptional regulator [Natrinema salsiterrestre]|uniref:Helix-turn-helix domain-containing protein n=1 Tax=Natrinema salsiterrestre TaxID=2950540 RepID=A0A9Q4L2H6_9EURY|nr:helix-turn-helix domain-containing protein [Natrinema salsiterrestre]MDF9746164.1 helix-turn-helix domain-containing protein [Natrinema salsiterrestre]